MRNRLDHGWRESEIILLCCASSRSWSCQLVRLWFRSANRSLPRSEICSNIQEVRHTCHSASDQSLSLCSGLIHNIATKYNLKVTQVTVSAVETTGVTSFQIMPHYAENMEEFQNKIDQIDLDVSGSICSLPLIPLVDLLVEFAWISYGSSGHRSRHWRWKCQPTNSISDGQIQREVELFNRWPTSIHSVSNHFSRRLCSHRHSHDVDQCKWKVLVGWRSLMRSSFPSSVFVVQWAIQISRT